MIPQHWLAGYKQTISRLVQLVAIATVFTGSYTIQYKAWDQIIKPA